MTACPHDKGARPYQDGWMVSAHDVVTQVALDGHFFFGHLPSKSLTDWTGAEHDALRALIDSYMRHERVDEPRPMFTATATRVVSEAIDRDGAD